MLLHFFMVGKIRNLSWTQGLAGLATELTFSPHKGEFTRDAKWLGITSSRSMAEMGAKSRLPEPHLICWVTLLGNNSSGFSSIWYWFSKWLFNSNSGAQYCFQTNCSLKISCTQYVSLICYHTAEQGLLCLSSCTLKLSI